MTIPLAALLSGCDQRPTITRADALEIATAQDEAQIKRIADLESQVQKLGKELNDLRSFSLSINKSLDRTQDVVSANAKVANDNALADMTLRGDCGREYVPAGNGGWVIANKKCTKADLKK